MISPIKLDGIWDEGYAMSQYSLGSKYLGEDAFGLEHYDTEYSEIGKLLYSMKYNGQVDTSKEIVELISGFISTWLSDKEIDSVIPVPPTKERNVQPVLLVAARIAEHIGAWYVPNVLEKITAEETKNIPKEERNLSGAIRKVKNAKRDLSVLLVDDLYSSGATASACTEVLKSDPRIKHVYFLAIAKTRRC